ncbi:tRNA 2'-phosphotransferase 1-like [Ptychodera flava]|uniref:tRNA 2'-phosphotransferase 1-like n=1 Tax=Ptychodera flava TaxID=63121 RepID=UPI003969E9B1
MASRFEQTTDRQRGDRSYQRHRGGSAHSHSSAADDGWSKRRGGRGHTAKEGRGFRDGRDVKLSKSLSWLFRQGAEKEGLQFDEGGYLNVEDILAVRGFNIYTAADIERLVKNYDSQRFSLRNQPENNRLQICANQNYTPKTFHSSHDNDVKLSKSLSWLLRHGAEKEGFTFDEGGYINVDDILALQRFKVHTTEDIERIVKNNDKQRFCLRNHPESNKLQICANQGHTIKVEGLQLTPITDPAQYPTVTHGTYWKAWEIIREQGLSKMRRNHIHFAPGVPGDEGVISGMRNSCEVLIFLDMEKALEDGLEFFISANNVILSSGNVDGLILPKYIKDAIQLHPRRKLPLGATS